MRVLITILFSLFFTLKSAAACVPNSGPLTPIIVDSVSVDAAGNVIICWEPSPDQDIAWYYIFHANPLTGANDVIDSVAAGTLCYTIPAANTNATNTVEEYAIGVRDLCDNSMLTILDYHNTIYLDNTVDICTSSIQLNWNAYDNFHSGLNVSYNIYASENAGSYQLIGTTNSLNFNFTGINQGSVYDIYVMAIENGGIGPFSSSSNVITVNTNFFLKNPAFLYLYTATVVDSQQITVQFYVDTSADIKEYEIQRAASTLGPFTTVSKVPDVTGMNPLVTYNDYSVEAKLTSYVYRINAINTCGTNILTSNFGQTILLTAISDKISAKNTLKFSIYQDWLGGVAGYEIYRAVGGIWESFPITTIPPFTGTFTYIDNIATILSGDGEFCYKIKAVEQIFVHVGNLPETTSQSNEACVFHNPIIYIPNAFNPTGEKNTVFKPILSYADPITYSLTIFDRWGHKVFETNDINEGWNGQFNNSGKMSPVGSYIYMVQFQSSLEEKYQKRGAVALIR